MAIQALCESAQLRLCGVPRILCVGGALASLIAAAYLDGLWAHAYLVFASAAGAAFAADISFRGMAYKILARAFKAE